MPWGVSYCSAQIGWRVGRTTISFSETRPGWLRANRITSAISSACKASMDYFSLSKLCFFFSSVIPSKNSVFTMPGYILITRALLAHDLGKSGDGGLGGGVDGGAGDQGVNHGRGYVDQRTLGFFQQPAA
ncbi:hypothetical protein SAMN05216198_0238 [Halopseudomonas litoralis]|uniref:Uncharacterized protein n=1 Tax=Halopseudomonas litoralis TaxID=797277 RepID=A0A1H1LGB4_9GAMM|nr:hypothetical protein [Halopseudomonas litoralis]SDR73352.1 hypothetical protein SAMN05216198_0238 [Halopseudomonas litoralis]